MREKRRSIFRVAVSHVQRARRVETVAAATWCIAGEAAFPGRRGMTGVYTVGRSVGRGVV